MSYKCHYCGYVASKFTNYCVNVNIMGNLAMRNSPILLKFFAGILI